MGHDDEASGDDRRRHQPAWLLIGLGAVSLVGALIGVVAFPHAWIAIAGAAVAQLAVTALVLTAARRPVIWAIAVAVICLGSALVDPVLSELAYSGASPWIGLATAAATLNLYRNADDWTSLAAGSAALMLGCAGLVAVSIRAGVPAATAIMATSVYLLLGVLAAQVIHLRNARQGRLHRTEVHEGARREGANETPAGADAAIRRALAIVTLRSDELYDSTEDASVRRAAADLREVAKRALISPSAEENCTARIDLHLSEAARDPNGKSLVDTANPALDLPDREQEILRLIATGASNASIARSLYLSEATVKQYVSRLMRKFQRENRTQLALLAAPWFPDE